MFPPRAPHTASPAFRFSAQTILHAFKRLRFLASGVLCAEAEMSRYAKQLATLRKECRHLRSRLAAQQQQESNGCSGDVDGPAASECSRGSRCTAAEWEGMLQPLQRLHQALHVPASQLASHGPAAEVDPWDLFEGLCNNLERATSHAEFVVHEWQQIKGSASFHELLARPVARTLPVDLLYWLRQLDPSDGSASGISTPGGSQEGLDPSKRGPFPLFACVRLAARLVRCAGALSVSGASEGYNDHVSDGSRGPSGALTRESSLSNTTPLEEEQQQCYNEGAPQRPGALEAERRLREEISKRQQLQHQAATLQRRIAELTEDLKDSRQRIEDQRGAEKERVKLAESEESVRLKGQLGSATEQLETVRQLYESLLEQYEKRHAAAAPQASEELAGENRDLLLQIRSWQASHAAISRSLQEALGELADLRADAARAQTLEKELEAAKREAKRVWGEYLPGYVWYDVEVELIRAHSERDAMEQELKEAKTAVDKYAKALKRLQSEALKGEMQDLERQLATAAQERDEAIVKAEKYVSDNRALSDGMQKLLQRLHAQVEEQEFLIDKRIVAQMITKHQEMHGQIKRRDEIFLLILDVLGFSEDDREKLGLPRKQQDKGKVS
ncbi:putative centrosomal protein [Cyclospora cayetanensis]|uniref:Centrosomal protein n=1 Tax=Cyclospora cayetanensis TaxID=88456 RepID=A0A1D3D6S1_9EIME|nr:putative centrosomal protein [Cyclospora cayetanensis]